MKKQLLLTLAICGVINPVHELYAASGDFRSISDVNVDIPPVVSIGASLAIMYALGNIYTRVITERATHYRFDNEIELVQKEGIAEDTLKEALLKTVLEKHYKNIQKGFSDRLSAGIRLLPHCKVSNNRKAFPLVQHEEDLDCY